MLMNISKDWIWCQYTPGAGGKMLCTMLQLGTKVHSWDLLLDKDYKKYINKRIKIDPATHLKKEPHFPYNLDWYTRQLPFKRGDNLSSDEVNKLFLKNNQSYSNKILVMQWCKPYIPKWFQGRVITIVNDKKSQNFLKKRRNNIFYKWKGNTVFKKRFMASSITNKHLTKVFKDNPEFKKNYESKTSFYQKEFYNHPEFKPLRNKQTSKQHKCNINLSNLFSKTGREIAKKLNKNLNLDIDLDKADYLLKVWLKNNQRFFDSNNFF